MMAASGSQPEPGQVGEAQVGEEVKRGAGAWLKLGILVALIVGLAWAVRHFGLYPPDVNGNGFDGEDLRRWVAGYGALGPALFILLYMVAPVVMIPGTPLTLGAGAIFGTGYGFLYVLVGSNLGANLAFVAARLLGRDAIEKAVSGGGVLKRVDDALARGGFTAILYLRLVPLVPFNALNYGSGLSPIRWPQYCLGTLLGMLPGIFAYVFLGGAILDAPLGELFFNRRFWIALSVFAAVALIPLAGRKLTRKQAGGAPVAKAPT